MTETKELAPADDITFDILLPAIKSWLEENKTTLRPILSVSENWLLINRDLNGRVRLILPESSEEDSNLLAQWKILASALMKKLGSHGYPDSSAILFETDQKSAVQGAASYQLSPIEFPEILLIDRLATESNWASIEPETKGSHRIVFFSIKGGVGRSTALSAAAWHFAQAGKRVLVLDLDLESPGLSSALLPSSRQPKYGIVDWLVEDLVENGDAVFDDMRATSNLSHDGEIHVVPAHGMIHGEYISKLGRVWMPKVKPDGSREFWSSRLKRLLEKLESAIKPDITFIDSRSGIDEIASACITDLGANLILLFSVEGEQTWNGYRMLFEQWLRAGVAQEIRERLQVVGALIPEIDRPEYLAGLRENSYKIFGESLYDEIAPAAAGQVGLGNDGLWRVTGLTEGWNFDEADEFAPHHPWAVQWNRSFTGLRSLQGRLAVIDRKEVEAIFGNFIDGINAVVNQERPL